MHAHNGLFGLLESGHKFTSPQPLYLLTKSNTLESSENVVYADKLRLKARAKSLDCCFMLDTDEIGRVQVVRGALKSLLTEMKSKFLSDIVKEKLNSECLEIIEKTNKCFELEHHLSSTEFANGIIRIIRHCQQQKCTNTSEIDEKDLKLVKKLTTIEFYQLNQIKTDQNITSS